ncbi:MAG: hypothetical protein Q9222_000148 [Ikaeria aurantiellina]
MFYSETLLSKTGPLARVWLSANLERKLSKTHILQSSIETSVNAIVDQGQAPMALRLSGQLLLGVAFRPGNVDLPANLDMPNPAALTVMDKISDPIMPELDPSLLDFRPMDVDFGTRKDDPLNWTSQLLSDPLSIEIGRNQPEQRAEYDDNDMDIDLILDVDDEPSIELGRNAPPPRPLEDDLFSDMDKYGGHDTLGLDLGNEGAERSRPGSAVPSLEPDEAPINGPGGIIHDEDDEVFALPIDDTTAPFDQVPDPRLQRASQSPLSSVRSSIERTFDAFHLDGDEEPSMHQPHQAKKRKVIEADEDTTISHTQIKAQQADRSAILRPASFLSRNPLFLSLTMLQQNGGFVTNVMGEGRAKGWAPELRDMLSLETVRRSGQLKRKRDSGIGDMGEDEQQSDGPEVRLEIPQDDAFAPADEAVGMGGEHEVRQASDILHLPAEDDFQAPVVNDDVGVVGREESEDDLISPGRDNFDDTEAPLLLPLEQGAVSLGTQYAVHLLRKRFGSSGDSSQPPAGKANILFQEMLPEATTSKADATKMFFEVLVLATKDAVKVEQSEQQLGGPMRIRGKRGLWAAWAEDQGGGEIDEHGTVARIFLLKFAKPNHREQIIVESGFRCHLTSFSRATAAAPSAFVTKLRKHLRTRRVTSVSQVGTDRIVELQFSDGLYRLFLEFYAGGNIVLTDQDLSILSLLRVVPEGAEQEEMRVGLKYALENRQNYKGIPHLTKERLQAALQKGIDKSGEGELTQTQKKKKKQPGDTLRKVLSASMSEFPPMLIDHALRLTGFDSSKPITEIVNDGTLIEELLRTLQEAQATSERITTGETLKGYIFARDRLSQESPLHETSTRDTSNESIHQSGAFVYEDFQPFKPLQLVTVDCKIIGFDSFNKSVDAFFSSIEGQKIESRLAEREQNAKRKIETARQDHQKRIDGLQQVQELNFRKAQIIEANLDGVQEAIGAVNGLIGQGMDWVEIARLIEMEQARHNAVAEMIKLPLKLYENTVTLLLGEEMIPEEEDYDGAASESEDESGGPSTRLRASAASNARLAVDIDLALSPWSNARQYYDQKKTAASKEQKTVQSSVKALRSTEKKIDTDLKKGLKQEKEVLRPVRKQLWFEKFLFFLSSEGYLVLGGKDAQQNDMLYKRYLHKGDIYVHADLDGTAIVIVKNKAGQLHNPIPPSTLSQAGSFAVTTSSAWDSKAVMSAWWVHPEQVSKITPQGDYLPPGNFVVSGVKNFLPPAHLLLGFGVFFRVSKESLARHLKYRIQDDDSGRAKNDNESESSIVDGSHTEDMPKDIGEHSDAESIATRTSSESGDASSHSEVEERDGIEDASNDRKMVEPRSRSASPFQENNRYSQNLVKDRHTSPPKTGVAALVADSETHEDMDHETKLSDPDAKDVQSPKLDNDNALSVRHLSTKDRRLLRKGQSVFETAKEDSIPIQGDGALAASGSETSAVNGNPAAMLQNHHVRGKHGKRNKLKTKYADQDDEDRALAMRLLGSTAIQEARDSTAAKASKEHEFAAQKQRRRQQHIAAAQKGKEEEEVRRAHLEEGFEAPDQTETEALEGLEAFIGTPSISDEILDAIVVCGPWDSIGTRCKWRAKIQPGSTKKGKAVREILASWTKAVADREKRKRQDAGDGNETMLEEEMIRKREGELLRGIREQEVVGAVPVGKVRLVMGAEGAGVMGKGGGAASKSRRGGRGSKKQR